MDDIMQNYDGGRLRRWSSTSHSYTCSIQIPDCKAWNQLQEASTLVMSADKTEFMCFKNLSGEPFKLVDKFMYIGSKISSTKNDVTIHLGRWRA